MTDALVSFSLDAAARFGWSPEARWRVISLGTRPRTHVCSLLDANDQRTTTQLELREEWLRPAVARGLREAHVEPTRAEQAALKKRAWREAAARRRA